MARDSVLAIFGTIVLVLMAAVNVWECWDCREENDDVDLHV